MSPLILHQRRCQHQQPNHQLLHQYQQQQQQPNRQAASITTAANVVDYSTQQQHQNQHQPSLSNSSSSTSCSTSCSTSTSGGSSTNRTTKATAAATIKIIHRQAHTHAAAHRLVVARNKTPPASGWKKPVVSSSSLALSSLVQPSPSSSTSTTDPISLSSSLSATAAETTTPRVDMEELLKLASNSTTPLSLKEMYKYAIVDVDNLEQRIRNAQFLHNE